MFPVEVALAVTAVFGSAIPILAKYVSGLWLAKKRDARQHTEWTGAAIEVGKFDNADVTRVLDRDALATEMIIRAASDSERERLIEALARVQSEQQEARRAAERAAEEEASPAKERAWPAEQVARQAEQVARRAEQAARPAAIGLARPGVERPRAARRRGSQIHAGFVAVIVMLVTMAYLAVSRLRNAGPPHPVADAVQNNPTLVLHLAALLTLALLTFLLRRQIRNSFKELDPAFKVLVVFATIVVLFTMSAAITFRHWLSLSPENFFKDVFLFLAMVAGMFVQVISSNFTHDRDLFKVSASQLVFPLLFSPFVYYPVLGLSSNAGVGFVLYVAFVNGYFWESVVSAVKAQVQKNTVAAIVVGGATTGGAG